MQNDPGFGAAPGRDDELVEKVARALCYNRAAPACDCKARGIPCRAPLENLLWSHNEISTQARAALAVARPAIREECLKPFDKRVTELVELREDAPLGEGAESWTDYNTRIVEIENLAAAIRAMP
jgi:hypothetical protein